jgi:hypothetical protein
MAPRTLHPAPRKAIPVRLRYRERNLGKVEIEPMGSAFEHEELNGALFV